MIGRLVLLALTLAAAKDDPLASRVAGAPVDCIDLDRVQGPDIRDDGTILYRQNGRRVWRVEPVDGCPRLRPLATLVVEIYGKRLCHNDRFSVVRPGDIVPGPICRFGRFTPYDKPRRR